MDRIEHENYQPNFKLAVGGCTPLISALGRQRQADLYELEASLICKSESQDSQGYAIEKTCLGEKNKSKQKQKHL